MTKLKSRLKNRIKHLGCAILGKKLTETFSAALHRKRSVPIPENEFNPSEVDVCDDFRKRIAEHPLAAGIHSEFARYCEENGNYSLALAEYRTANVLGANEDINACSRRMGLHLPCKDNTLDYNVHYRMKSIVSSIDSFRSNDQPLSILDVGGGSGGLAQFLREEDTYCLADPAFNGISGTDLPLGDRSFDLVVSCHVLEHIPHEDRDRFLDMLVSKASQAVILLNPFDIHVSRPHERIELIINVTNAQWAKEHRDCKFPKVAEVEDYAKRRKLAITIEDNGCMATSLAFVFLQYFAHQVSGSKSDLDAISKYFNTLPDSAFANSECPNAYLVTLHSPGSSNS